MPLNRKQSIPLGVIAGFADATGGGGWGPMTTPILLSRKGLSPRKVVGTVDTSEFAIAVSATMRFSYFIRMGGRQLVMGVFTNGKRNYRCPYRSMAGAEVSSAIDGCACRRIYYSGKCQNINK